MCWRAGPKRSVGRITSPMLLYTLGHSAHPLEKFLALLGHYGLSTLVEVRSMTASRFQPQYNRVSLERALTDHGIRNVFAGQALAGPWIRLFTLAAGCRSKARHIHRSLTTQVFADRNFAWRPGIIGLSGLRNYLKTH